MFHHLYSGYRVMIPCRGTSMNIDDQILRAYATITSIRANVPERHEVEARWVNEFNAAIAKLEKSLGIDSQI